MFMFHCAKLPFPSSEVKHYNAVSLKGERVRAIYKLAPELLGYLD
jgi:hypothetical protein